MDQPGSLKSHLLHGATGTLILSIVSNIMALIISVVLARLLGTKEFGIYAYTMAVVNMLLVLSMLGLPQLIIREISAYRTNHSWGLMRGLLTRAYQITFIASIVIAIGVAIFVLMIKGQISIHALHVILIGLILLPILVSTNLGETTIRGLGYILLSQIPKALLRPCIFLILLIAAYLFWNGDYSATTAISMQVISTFVTFVTMLFMLWKVLPMESKNTPPAFQTKVWMRSALPLLFVGAMLIVNNQTDILMLGALENAKEVGIYRVAQRGAGLVSLGLAAINIAIGPTISILHTKGEMYRLQRIATRSAQMALVFSLPLVLVLVVFGSQLVSFVYGIDFSPAAKPMAILCVAQILTAILGSAGLLLTMCGHERDTAKGFAFSAGLNVTLNAFMIPMWGVRGAAIATGTSMISLSILFALLVYRRIGINATVFRRLG